MKFWIRLFLIGGILYRSFGEENFTLIKSRNMEY